ncbi:MAG: crossover junction endodeoxyribonuclease RuvC [Myxococcales bacterium]|nr:crossover junction endodeoxyribonuclease RuvC [Myxococcales bacterium]
MSGAAARLILGVDPGSRITGYAMLSQRGRQLAVVESGVISLRENDPLAARLGALANALDALLDRVTPDEVAVEDVFSARNARTALKLGQARGAVLCTVGRRALAVSAYPPATVKRAVAGHGRADKGQIQRMVQVLLGLADLPRTDEADAMAVAICHGLMRRGADAVTAARRAR